MADEKTLALPGSSWETVKKIIRAFYAANDKENATVDYVANLAGIQRPVVSMNNNFLRSVGLVKSDQWKLTEIGIRYGTGLQMNNISLASESLVQVIRNNPVLAQLLNLVKARGEMKTETFKAEVLLKLGITPNDRQAQFIKPLLDMFQEAGLIDISDDTLKLSGGMYGLDLRDSIQALPPTQVATGYPPVIAPSRSATAPELPLLLAPNRIVYMRLPDDWDSKKDLPKLLKLLEISLGDEV